MRISDWSSDVCSSDLGQASARFFGPEQADAFSRTPSPEGQLAAVPSFPARGGGLPAFGSRDRGWDDEEIGRASCRERVCQYVEISVVAVALTHIPKYTYS